jgi:ABC-type sugar transport system ATPase subunit
MDEPTSSLNDVETRNLFRFIHRTAANGVAILYISHKLEELFEVADRVVIIRDGSITGEVLIEDASKQLLISKMVGRDLTDMYPKKTVAFGEDVISVHSLQTSTLNNLSFSARKGEIFGIYGLMGSGHQSIGSAIFGEDTLISGEIHVNSKLVNIKNPMDAIDAGIAYVPAERKTEGLVLNQSVAVNIMSAYYSKRKPLLVNKKKDKKTSNKWIANLAIKTPSCETITESLSGGNQQKVIISKWLELQPNILILNEPTRGIDVGAKAEIYRILEDLVSTGKCVIFITSEMPELLAMSDRIMVMFEGKMSGILNSDEATQEKVVRYAIGDKEYDNHE